VSSPLRIAVALFALSDLAAGLVLLWLPGLVEELLHPLAMATTFRLHQWLGVVALGRGVVGAYAALRGDVRRLGSLALLWALPVPADALLAWNTADTGPRAALAYGLHAALSAAWAVTLLYRSRGTSVAHGAHHHPRRE
jgi:hypothetical protein